MRNDHDDFSQQLIALLPRLRIQALALTRNASGAADLVQDAVTNALAARDSFSPGTNFPAWMHRILRNRFISDTRRRRPAADLDAVPEAVLAVPAAHEESLMLKELHAALGRLPLVQRETLLMVVLQGMSYEDVADTMGCAVGTAKSRVFRARQQLETWLIGETPAAAIRSRAPIGDAGAQASAGLFVTATAARLSPAAPMRIAGGPPC
ncbi:sigma-70 family RNA polymerase sigma factor [Paracraurococcus ruber]|uniref:DNA-directed RNA polymerase sigma-70 factor n=1 Tax=Paracraurococcus ruber TaxID=77675 RepID=A0ABS1CZR1_9PROT|nr:sigma-70 family RNA polymerase sigma factor [Paracraurococcus ruber]MBK1659935.1 DNA-directed RNA polymerase sigma-70 factor [Paracraurococcus ruber]TDG29750.1 sigma-70 family RNA polymerase sigma factor [Paracraurococcus ruber]